MKRLFGTLRSVGSKLLDATQTVRDTARLVSAPEALETSVRSRITEESPFQAELPWRAITTALRESSNPVDRRQLFLGFEGRTRALVLVPINGLWAHAYVSGASDAGKTARALLPTALQLVACTDERDRGPLLIVDLKGEPYFFHAVRAAAAAASRRFRFFTNIADRWTHAFNPILDLQQCGLTSVEVRDHIRLGMNIEFGAEYGKEHFAALNREELDLLLADHPDATTFGELASFLPGPRDPGYLKRAESERRQHSVSLRMAIKDLARVAPLNITPGDNSDVFAERVNMRRAFSDNEVLYFFLKNRPQETVVRITAALAVECFYAACRYYNEGPIAAERGMRHGYVIIDEFQNIAGRNFDGFMETARSAGLSLLLASQSPEKLEALGIAHAIEHSTGYRQFFSARSPKAKAYLKALASDTIETSGELDAEEHLVSRLSTSTLNIVDATPGMSIAVISRNADYAQYNGEPVIVDAPYAMTEADRDAFVRSSWPVEPGLMLPSIDGPGVPPSVLSVSAIGASPGDSLDQRTPEVHSARKVAPCDTALARALASIRLTADGYLVGGQTAHD